MQNTIGLGLGCYREEMGEGMIVVRFFFYLLWICIIILALLIVLIGAIGVLDFEIREIFKADLIGGIRNGLRNFHIKSRKP